MHDETTHDNILFDRLVDGDLSDAERRRLLESLDTRPDGWRHCALAFLEAQSWRDDLGALVLGPAQRQTDAQGVSPSTVGDRRPLRRGMTWLAIAAGLLVAFRLGLMQRNDGGQVVNLPRNPAAPLADVPRSAPLQTPGEVRGDDALTLWARDDTGQPRSLRVPLVDAGALDRQFGVAFQSGVPDDVRAQLNSRGYNVESKRRYAPLWLDNGRPMIVPVEDTKIVPVSQRVY